METTFKVGDTVVKIGGDCCSAYDGTIYTVQLDSFGTLAIGDNEKELCHCTSEWSLVPVLKFKIGDSVRCFYDDGYNTSGMVKGKSGKINGYSGDSKYPYLTDFGGNYAFGNHELEAYIEPKEFDLVSVVDDGTHHFVFTLDCIAKEEAPYISQIASDVSKILNK